MIISKKFLLSLTHTIDSCTLTSKHINPVRQGIQGFFSTIEEGKTGRFRIF